MLRLRRLEIEGFGPFATPQLLEFPKESGVVVVYGENMRGKTSLLNAIRYAFFGQALGRGSRQRRLHEISNRDLAGEGKYGFSVELGFEYDGVDYDLVRECRPRVIEPTNDDDYNETLLMRGPAGVLGPQEAQHLLGIVFPSEISRFFLFDGELLQEYEELLVSGSEAGRKISQAIERILGVPILKQGWAHLVQLSQQADEAAAKDAQRQAQTAGLGSQLQSANVMRTQHQKELERLEGELKDLRRQKADFDTYFASMARYSALLEDKQKAEAAVKDAETAESSAAGEIKRLMSDAWRTALRERVRVARTEMYSQVDEALDEYRLSLRVEAVEAGHCAVCDQTIAQAKIEALRSGLPSSLSPETTRDLLSNAMAKLRALERFGDVDITAEVRSVWSRLHQARIEQIARKEDIRELDGQLTDADLEGIRKSKMSYDDVSRKIYATEEGIAAEQDRLSEVQAAIERFRRTLEATGGPDLKASQQRASLLRDAQTVFRSAVDKYKEHLREEVQASASELFLAMTTEKRDYSSLSINDAYGLSIIHRDGRAEEARSAGAEHVVALALMGALQRNAPLRGPIVMDSPFGRLDEDHTANVVRALPSMAPQVVLLVYEAEVGVDQMRSLLGTSLRREYRLAYVSARRTDIEEIR
jgi:DNA sulfur modification protein DndD